jgi:RluA family pseudouridine synthase
MNPINDIIETVFISFETDEYAYGFLNGKFSGLPSRKALKKALKAERIIDLDCLTPLNERSMLRKGMRVGLRAAKTNTVLWKTALAVVYEDNDLAIIDKPAGMAVSSSGHRALKNALPENLQSSSSIDRLAAPTPVHRLDFDTAGLVMVAKTYSAARVLGDDFSHHQISKRYHARVIGTLNEALTIDEPIDGKPAVTHIEVLRQGAIGESAYTELALFPMHGRHHQLRRHLFAVNHPIIGDRLYRSATDALESRRLWLEHFEVSFTHPRQGHRITCRRPKPLISLPLSL